jgi:hypothetical protein
MVASATAESLPFVARGQGQIALQSTPGSLLFCGEIARLHKILIRDFVRNRRRVETAW